MKRNPVAQELRTPKFKPKKVESKKKYNRKKEVTGYYYDGYNDKTETLYKEKKRQMKRQHTLQDCLMVKGPLLIKNILNVRKKVMWLTSIIAGVSLWRLQ